MSKCFKFTTNRCVAGFSSVLLMSFILQRLQNITGVGHVPTPIKPGCTGNLDHNYHVISQKEILKNKWKRRAYVCL